MRISYKHPRFNDIKREVERRFNSEFNEVDLEDAEEKADGCLSEHILQPSFSILAKEWYNDTTTEAIVEEFLIDKYSFPIEEDKAGFFYTLDEETPCDERYESEEDAEEARDLALEAWAKNFKLTTEMEEDFYEWLEENYERDVVEHYEESEHYPMWSTLFECRGMEDYVDSLYELGIGVIEGFENYDSMLFISGAGYDFYEQHWIPMMLMMGWVDLKRFPDPNAKITECTSCGRDVFKVARCNSAKVVEGKLVENGPYEHDKPTIHCTWCGTEFFFSNFEEACYGL